LSVVLLILLLVLVAINGLFVAAEFALVRSRRARVESLAEEDSAGARRVLDQIERMDEYLSACQVGITMASIGIGFLGEPAVAQLLIDAFGFTSGLAHALAVAFAFAFVTAIHISFGEQVPKLVAIDRAEVTARRLSRPVALFKITTAPFTQALTKLSNAVARLFGVNPDELEQEYASEDLKAIIDQSRLEGQLDPGEAGMLSGVFHLHEQQAREVMTPIPAVVTVDATVEVEEAVRRCVSSGHTRLLVIEDDNPDRVRGLVHVNSLSRLLMNSGPDASIDEVITDAWIVPETKPLDDLLAELQRQRRYMGVVVDEYGRTVGIVTVEDILEEVVGEIEDETDARAASVRRLGDGDWYVRGHVPLGDLEDVGIELPVDTDAYNSVGGYVFGQIGRLPKRGDTITADGYTIKVESVRENRIVAVRIQPPPAEASKPAADAAA
jgi:CBS domain containing-hemolysin-like protein